MSTPDWIGPVARYVLEVGLRNTLKLSAIALVGSTLIGVTLGTLLTIRFLPTRALIRLYIEIWRGLPILVTIFIVYFALPAVSSALRFDAITAGAIAFTRTPLVASSLPEDFVRAMTAAFEAE